jgi:hypothetical protein
MPLSEAQKYLDHLGACSPCYRDFLEVQAKYRQRRTRMIFAVAASVLIVAGLATWAIVRQHVQQIASAVLDLRDRSLSRGTEPPPTEPPLEIPQHVSHLQVFLPIGSSEGAYDVSISTVPSGPVFFAHGNAQAEKGITELQVDLNLPLTAPGRYVLRIRRPTSEWASFPLQVR